VSSGFRGCGGNNNMLGWGGCDGDGVSDSWARWELFGVRFVEKPSDEEQEQERGISVMFVDFLSKRQKMYSTHAHSTNANPFIKHSPNLHLYNLVLLYDYVRQRIIPALVCDKYINCKPTGGTCLYPPEGFHHFLSYSIGMSMALQLSIHVSLSRSRTYFRWKMKIPCLSLATSMPKKYFKWLKSFFSGVNNMSFGRILIIYPLFTDTSTLVYIEKQHTLM
jgi:hypothetical protein